MTVRTTRYYACLGLIPRAVRRGRIAYYDETHRARLEMVRALQDHGFTLQAIERVLVRCPRRGRRGPRAAAGDAHLVVPAAARDAHPPPAGEEGVAPAVRRDLDLLVELGTLERSDGLRRDAEPVGRRGPAGARHPAGQHGRGGRRDPPAHGGAGRRADRDPAHAGARALPPRAALARGRGEAGAHHGPAAPAHPRGRRLRLPARRQRGHQALSRPADLSRSARPASRPGRGRRAGSPSGTSTAGGGRPSRRGGTTAARAPEPQPVFTARTNQAGCLGMPSATRSGSSISAIVRRRITASAAAARARGRSDRGLGEPPVGRVDANRSVS